MTNNEDWLFSGCPTVLRHHQVNDVTTSLQILHLLHVVVVVIVMVIM